ncbi:hypothetical protein FIBSPDRAFT_218367 [Athelia psychrophila]|uniref:Uncharacterized protein n=1 Tax=Athelia psychrophila TaxID=1759441 RepID=A0A165Z920_9AGAM|nr:hypothetical protein FIBSPDRAFT_218367 [Fibularhizoctonia sp. CBS 109695]
MTYTALVLLLATLPSSIFLQSQNSYRGEVHAHRFDGALRGPESDSINSTDFGVAADFLVAIFSAFGEADVQGVLPSVFGLALLLRVETEEDVIRSEACIGNVVDVLPKERCESGAHATSCRRGRSGEENLKGQQVSLQELETHQ